MDSNKIINAIRAEILACNDVFFDFVWRNKIENILTEESRFSALANWCETELKLREKILQCFNPADKTDKYSIADFQNFQKQLNEIAMLIWARETLLDSHCTEEQRTNVEYTICKIFVIRWCEQLKTYVGDKNERNKN